VSAVTAGSQSAAYAYDSANQRIYYRNTSGTETIYFYGADGRKVATYTYTIITSNGVPEIQLTQQSENVYFLGKLILAEGSLVTTDRLGSVRNGGPGVLGYQAQYPYGVEYTVTANDREKYATYTRDSVTGLDYAMNRYYASQWGRFLSPDPYMAGARPASPQSWNRYAYAENDPINGGDPAGLYTCLTFADQSYYPDWEEFSPEFGPPWEVGSIYEGIYFCPGFAMGFGGAVGPGGGGAFPKCASAGTQTQLAFVANHYAAASAEAAAIQSEMPTIVSTGAQVQANQTNLTDAFLDWSAWESGWGTAPFATSHHNYFGYGNVYFPSSTSWGTELASILGSVPHTLLNPNVGNAPYSSFLVSALTSSPSAGPAAILQSIASAGYNSVDPNYGSDIANAVSKQGTKSLNDTIKGIINCLKSNGYI
jgi:RHS repeat-associated protein